MKNCQICLQNKWLWWKKEMAFLGGNRSTLLEGRSCQRLHNVGIHNLAVEWNGWIELRHSSTQKCDIFELLYCNMQTTILYFELLNTRLYLKINSQFDPFKISNVNRNIILSIINYWHKIRKIIGTLIY